MKSLAIFASSNASDLPAIVEQIEKWILKWKCQIKLWVVNKEWIWAISKFENWKIPYHFFAINKTNKEKSYSEIHELLKQNWIDFIICVWWFNIIPESFVNNWNKKILNVHPSLLPKFPWAHAIDDTLKAWMKKTWCTVHFIDEWIDTWEIIIQKEVEILPNDNAESLKSKIQKAEQEIYPKAILEVIQKSS